jgi:hypothetical protein
LKKSLASATGAAAASESETAILKQVGQTLSSHNRIALFVAKTKPSSRVRLPSAMQPEHVSTYTAHSTQHAMHRNPTVDVDQLIVISSQRHCRSPRDCCRRRMRSPKRWQMRRESATRLFKPLRTTSPTLLQQSGCVCARTTHLACPGITTPLC